MPSQTRVRLSYRDRSTASRDRYFPKYVRSRVAREATEVHGRKDINDTMATGRGFCLALFIVVASAVDAFIVASSSSSASAASRVGTTPFERLANVELTSVATGQPTLLTSQWRNSGLFPWQNEKCVVEFL